MTKIKDIEQIDDKIQDLIQLYRLMWPNFNSVPVVEKVIVALNEAYRANGKLADAIDKGWIEWCAVFVDVWFIQEKMKRLNLNLEP